MPTAELPKPEDDSAGEQVRLSTAEINYNRRYSALSEELHDTIEYSLPVRAQDNGLGEETVDIATADVKGNQRGIVRCFVGHR